MQDWLAPHLAGMTRLAELARLDLLPILRGHAAVGPRARGWIATLPSASGAARRARGGGLYRSRCRSLSARAQAFYGLTTTPRLADGRVPLQLALLSPAGTAGRRSPATWRVSGAAPGPMCGATCAAAIRSMTGRKTRRPARR